MNHGGVAAEFLALLGDVRRRWVRVLTLCTMGRAAGAAAVILIVAAVLERVLRPAGLSLLLLSAATLTALAGVVLAVVRRLWISPDDRQVARFVEERAVGAPMEDALVTAVDVTRPQDEAARSVFRDLVVGHAVRLLRETPASAVLDGATMRRAVWQALAGSLALCVALVAFGPSASRAFDTARLQFFPGSLALEVAPGNLRIPAGKPVRITATVHDGEEVLTRLTPTLLITVGSETRSVPMSRAGTQFEAAIDKVDRPFAYRVTAGAARSSEYTVTPLFGPRVRRVDLEYVYPAFTALPPRVEEDGGDIYAPAGTRVRFRVHTDKPIVDAVLVRAQSATPLKPSADRVLVGDIVLAKDESYRIRLTDGDGLQSSDDAEYFIRIMEDRPPDVRILRPSADQQITPLEEVAIEARADDDYGVAQLDLVYSVAGGKEHVVRFDRITGTEVEKIGSRLLAAEDLRVQPGDVISYYARARDVARGKRSTESRSDIFFLEVKPFSEEFVAAESQAGSSAPTTEIDSLVSAQKEIISATWNIERRSGAGRSAEDIAAIARAQAELKGKVERMSGGAAPRRRGRAPAPQQVQALAMQEPAGAADPIAAAAQAMARALQQLDGQKTKDALVHQMAALNGLLQAQAEVRRRQVSQGSSGSGSGGNRASQDLSALFDKELQRQQRTNYENRPSIENPRQRDSAQQSALDRIKDLARRQEELSRRQRELADAQLSAEEMKRQLEKLTREQIELRQQAEDLARDLQRQQGQSGQQGKASGEQRQPGQAGGGMTQAADAMRSAASELRRDNAEAAARDGARATEQLRRLEEQMRGGSASAEQKTAGELQLEAQQVAQEQRRMASEASRLEKSGASGSEDARRRLADEQERLASRVDSLQKSAARAGKEGKGNEAAAAAAAARSLETQKVAERMRDASRQMRGNHPAGTGARQQEIARALEGAADKLGGGSAEARRLSDRLQQTGAIRDRLNRLEQQVRDAEARARQGSRGREGAQGAQGSGGEGRKAADDVKRLQQEYQRELERARDALAQLGKGEQRTGTGMATPEMEEFSRSAPGNEAFKQDRSGWESLRKEIDRTLERYEASVSDRLRQNASTNRLESGGNERVPDAYRAWIARYYRSLAKGKR